MDKKIVAIFAVIAVVAAGFAAFAIMSDDGDPDTGDHVDAVGNEIKPHENVESIACLGQNSLRIVSYLQMTDKVSMVDVNDSYHYVKTYMYYASEDIFDLPCTHTNCGITADDVAKLIDEVKPEVIIMGKTTCYDGCTNEVKSLYEAGFDIVVIDDYLFEFLDTDKMAVTESFDDMVRDVGYAIGASDRADELLDDINNKLIPDIRGLVEGKTTDKTAYMGCVSYNGTHPLYESIWSYIPFSLAGVKCILPEGKISEDGSVSVAAYSAADLEKWSDENTVFFIDANGFSKLKTSDETQTGLIQMWADNEVYLVPNYVGTGMNYENGFIISYQIIHYLFGDDILSKEQFAEKADFVYDIFFGTHISNRTTAYAQDKNHDGSSGYAPLPEGTDIYDDQSYVFSKLRGAPFYGTVDFKSDGTFEVKI